MAEVFQFNPTHIAWDVRHSKILATFLEGLEAEGIAYVILKNSEGLPQENHSKDIDILIEPGRYEQSATLLKNVYRENGVTHSRVHQFEKLRCWYGFNPETRLAIHIDLIEGFFHKGFELFPFKLLYKHAVKNEQGIYVLNELYDAIVLLLHSTICYHHIKSKYAKKIAKVYASHKQEMYQVLVEVLGREVSGQLVCCLETGDYGKIAKSGRYYSLAAKWRALKRRPNFSLYNVCTFLWEKVERLIINRSKYNVFISVHAPDGTGKTTFIREFCQILGYYYVCSPQDLVSVHHFRPCILPNLGAAGERMGIVKQDKDFTSPHRAKLANKWSSLLRMAYYTMDYLIGLPMILRRNAQFDRITIFDRYIYDLAVDPARTRISLPMWLRLFFVGLVKKPRLSFVLHADAETILGRKQELTLEEIERQLSEFRSLAEARRESFVILDALKKPGDMAQDAVKVFLDKFADRL